MKEKSNFEGYTELIKNMPYTCTYCKNDIEQGKEKRFEIQRRHEPFCDIDCAIDEVKRRIKMYKAAIKSLEKREENLTFLKLKGE